MRFTKEYEKTQSATAGIKTIRTECCESGTGNLFGSFFKAKRSAWYCGIRRTAIGVVEICQQLAIPLVVHFHGYDAYSQEVLEVYASAYKTIFRYCSGIIAVSRPMVEQLIRIGAPKEKIVYNACGVDITVFKNGCCRRRITGSG